MREIEIKIRFECADTVRQRLGLLGAVAAYPRSFEDNRIYDDAERSFSKGHRLLRLRSTRGRHVLTFKHPPEHSEEGARYKVRIEHETELTDIAAAASILDALGYTEVWRYQKYRQRYDLDGITIELDEMPFGVFVEIEGAPEAIDKAARALGCTPDDYLRDTYHALFAAHTGVEEPGDLVFEDRA